MGNRTFKTSFHRILYPEIKLDDVKIQAMFSKIIQSVFDNVVVHNSLFLLTVTRSLGFLQPILLMAAELLDLLFRTEIDKPGIG